MKSTNGKDELNGNQSDECKDDEIEKHLIYYTEMEIVWYGLWQCLTAPLVIGWLWGILYMWTVVQYTNAKE